ncbi:response regulator transcription factor [Streptomyces sp. So13.3]|uniref:response regulator transcription factor n=1 Tax=unclassified Streptomyces TaxID=2593676 RepID=UPI0011061FE1|nr:MULTISPECIES: response regulator transcription factor [unclassified Streptomyces]MCZ4101610.1 response regulator transcription factor [Streptomyces sp. H39-C1]QNA76361.1 response regulator transcription factor [Streptomyces sp. So13.3]
MTTEAIQQTQTEPVRELDDMARCSHLKLLVALDNDVVRWGLCSMLDALPTVHQTTGCGTHREALNLLQQSPQDVVVASSALNGDLAQLSTQVHAAGGKLLLLLSNAGDEAMIQAAAQYADGFLLETGLTPEVLQDALSRLLRGEMPMPTALARELLSMVRRRDKAPRGLFLTPREQEALALLVDGYSNKQIARRLNISEHGAKRHVANVLAKLNCSNRTLAVAMALRDGLVPQVP